MKKICISIMIVIIGCMLFLSACGEDVMPDNDPNAPLRQDDETTFLDILR